jgi:hypothetical protein
MEKNLNELFESSIIDTVVGMTASTAPMEPKYEKRIGVSTAFRNGWLSTPRPPAISVADRGDTSVMQPFDFRCIAPHCAGSSSVDVGMRFFVYLGGDNSGVELLRKRKVPGRS